MGDTRSNESKMGDRWLIGFFAGSVAGQTIICATHGDL